VGVPIKQKPIALDSDPPHHQLFIREIEAFLESEEEVLLLFAPPGSAKSTFVSILLPSWYLAANPTHSILAATHNVEFAERWGRRVRNDIAVDSQVLGISLSEDSKAAARWSLASGGEYYGVGAGVGISGFRANLGVGTTCSAHVRMPIATLSDKSAGIGTSMTLVHA
jgi:hypothetical protein